MRRKWRRVVRGDRRGRAGVLDRGMIHVLRTGGGLRESEYREQE